MCILIIFVSSLHWVWKRSIGKALWKIAKQCNKALWSFWSTNLYVFLCNLAYNHHCTQPGRRHQGLLGTSRFHSIKLLSKGKQQGTEEVPLVLWLSGSRRSCSYLPQPQHMMPWSCRAPPGCCAHTARQPSNVPRSALPVLHLTYLLLFCRKHWGTWAQAETSLPTAFWASAAHGWAEHRPRGLEFCFWCDVLDVLGQVPI